MSVDVDEAEHSIEMQLPYIYKILSRYAPSHCSPLAYYDFRHDICYKW